MKKLIVLLLASSLAACTGSSVEDPLRPVYHAKFKDGSLDCCILVDRIHAPDKVPLEKGQSGVGEIAQWTEGHGALALTLTAPNSIPENANPSMGIFSTGLDFGPGKIFLVRATFQRPRAPAGLFNGWAVGLAARTGGKDDLYAETRLGVTLTFKNGSAELRFREGDKTANSIKFNPDHQDVYDKIMNDAQPFTLELRVDRKAGKGAVTLITRGGFSPRIDFDPAVFKASDGPPITAVGATLANCCGEGKQVDVEVTDFQIWEPGRQLPKSQP